MASPKGVSARDWNAALEQFRRTVGSEWVLTSDEDVAMYKDAYSPFMGEPQEITVSAAVCPTTTEQVQEIMRTANRYRIPIYPISTGKNLGYGGSAPNLSGSVVLDLKRMNKILKVDEERAFALVEPGVSYFDLYRYIQEKKLKLWIDCPDPGWGSPVGNSLDHGVGYTTNRFRNHFDVHCGMEVVLPTGELIRTGMGAMPAADTWQDYKYGVGPWVDGIFSQSNYGVVTKMGIWLFPAPDHYLAGRATVYRFEDIHPLVATVTRLENLGITNGMPSFGSALMPGAAFFGGGATPDPELVEMFTPGRPEPTAAQVNDYAKRKGVGVWTVELGFYGGEITNAANWEYCKQQIAAAIPGATFKDEEAYHFPLPPEKETFFDLPRFGIPSLQRFIIGARSEFNDKPSSGHVWFSPIIPRTGQAILDINRVLRPYFNELGMRGLNLYMTPAGYFERSFVYTFGFMISTDPAENKKMRERFEMLAKVCAEHGWGEYRAAPAFQKVIMETFSFNNHSLLRLHETLKDAVDPNGILAAGRYGIWPKHLRGKQA
jgi:FAD/FMN-containing dehydrogenase